MGGTMMAGGMQQRMPGGGNPGKESCIFLSAKKIAIGLLSRFLYHKLVKKGRLLI